MTGQLEEEEMRVYVRLGIRLLYKGAFQSCGGGKGVLFILISAYLCFICFLQARRLLESLLIKQGIK